jgi:hypothetical protein
MRACIRLDWHRSLADVGCPLLASNCKQTPHYRSPSKLLRWDGYQLLTPPETAAANKARYIVEHTAVSKKFPGDVIDCQKSSKIFFPFAELLLSWTMWSQNAVIALLILSMPSRETPTSQSCFFAETLCHSLSQSFRNRSVSLSGF